MEELNYILDLLKSHKDAFSALRDISLIFVGIISVWFLAKRVNAMEKAAKASTREAEISDQRISLEEEKNITAQYIKAVEQLGSGGTTALGGIYALEKIAFLTNDFQYEVFEVLSAYIRNSATHYDPTYESEYKPKSNVQAALNVIGRRPKDIQTEINLSGSCLSKYKLEGNFSNASFNRCNLKRASFLNADCKKASFLGADCEKIEFLSSNLEHADIVDSSLKEAVLANTNCKVTNFRGSDLRGTVFHETDHSLACFDETVTTENVDTKKLIIKKLKRALSFE